MRLDSEVVSSVEKPLTIRSYGKWILAGEHAVLRGCPALVFPLESRYIETKLSRFDESVRVQFTGKYSEEISLLFWGLVDRALEKLNRQRQELRGHLQMDCQIPLGAGLGASAALCVSVCRWMVNLKWLTNEDIYDFARELEDLFHGESSGVDIAVALGAHGIRFVRGRERLPLNLNWKPQWFLSYCGQRGVTSECVHKIRELTHKDPHFMLKLDQQMAEAVKEAEEALIQDQSDASLAQLALAINQASDCFRQWGLCEGKLEEHMKWLRDQGALAIKPTGSGGGGYVLSLWDKELSPSLKKHLFPA